MNKNRHPNFMVVDKSKIKETYHHLEFRTQFFVSFADTPLTDIEDCLKKFIKRDDIDIILINQNVAELVRTTIDGHTAPVPAILEIPSKDHPYDPSKDSILRRAKGMFNPEDMR